MGFASHGTWWQLPFRRAAMDVPYLAFYVRNLERRPRREVAESGVLFALSIAVITATLATGSFWLLAVIYLIPERIAIIVLGWWFDWLPHHGLEDTQSENRYHATRVRVGMEWLLTPPISSATRRSRPCSVSSSTRMSSAAGSSRAASCWSYCRFARRAALRPRTRSFTRCRCEPSDGSPTTASRSRSVPAQLHEQFQFTAGQHLTVATDLGPQGAGRFGTTLDPLARKSYVAIAAGSGITPHLSNETCAQEREHTSGRRVGGPLPGAWLRLRLRSEARHSVGRTGRPENSGSPIPAGRACARCRGA
jgi:hypothetical protein